MHFDGIVHNGPLKSLKRDTQNPFVAKPNAPGSETVKTESGVSQEAQKVKSKNCQNISIRKNLEVEIDLDGIADRIIEFPVAEGSPTSPELSYQSEPVYSIKLAFS